ncbi:ShlB/FhaC/HecB family hemolysin secretion/activation protein [Desulfobacula sp.]|uniref:ShlB/FhaC/HecB family hemolysin secretion/activation protein n=1 Tax=Desulfobacula sp. TaxID=2593537 RepID=UPI00262956EB|nr:ShlB/FhaC/HecB family hemolysin secretion/activation protein [Desulfobacula sp.]
MKQLGTLKQDSHHPGSDKSVHFFFLPILLLIVSVVSSQAQEFLLLDPTGYPGEKRLPLMEPRPSDNPPGLILPVQPAVKNKTDPVPIPEIMVREIVVTGNTVFSDLELGQITAPYLNRLLTNEMLDEIRHTLTLHYINNGYVNSGAIIPDQAVVDGKLIFNIIEGRISQIVVKGNKWFRKEYIADRICLDAGPALNIGTLQKRLQQLQQDQRIDHVQAELKPGVTLGESLMKVEVEEKNPYQILFGYDNYQAPTIGAERGLATLIHQNLTGHGDILNLTGVASEDNDPQMDFWYTLPITSQDTTLTVSYRKNDLDIREEPFETLDIVSESEVFQITLRHPFYRTLTQEFAMAFSGENNKNKAFLLGEPFSFSPGAVDGESINTVLRFAQEWTHRTRKQVVAARSKFSFGINEMNATIHDNDLPDGRFFAWLGQIQWAGRLDALDTQLIFRTDLQLSNDSLLGLEQIAVGGRYSVRGYRENQMVRDQALITSVEARVPLIRERGWTEYLQLAAFFDFGAAWNKFLTTPSPNNISSIGLGLRWAGILMKSPFEIRPKFEIYWGCPLRDVDTPGGNLQDHGIHFQFVVKNF